MNPKKASQSLRWYITAVRRLTGYAFSRPKTPCYGKQFPGPVVIVGSAPVANKPSGLDDSFTIISVNASQHNAKKWGISVPDITFLQNNQIEGTNENAVNVRRVLSGERTRLLYILRWPYDFNRLQTGLDSIDYKYDKIELLNRFERMALHKRVMGEFNLEIGVGTKFSNGIAAVFYAILNGADQIILSGINPNSNGHAYSSGNLKRHHVSVDREIVAKLLAKGYRIYTADPDVAEQLHIPFWTGHSQEAALSNRR